MQHESHRDKQIVSILFTCVILAGAFFVLSPFLFAIIWAAIIAIASWPLYLWVEHKCKGRPILASWYTTIVISIALVGPISLFLIFLSQDVVAVTNFLIEADRHGVAAPVWLPKLPWVGDYLLSQWNQYLALPDQLSGVLHQAMEAKLNVIRDTARDFLLELTGRLATLFFALWVLFFLYKDGRKLIALINQIGYRWLEKRWAAYVDLVPGALRAAVNGLVIVGFAEGVLLSIVFYFCGVPSPFLLGIALAILAFIPMVAPLLLVLIGIVLFASGATFAAFVVVILGMIIVFGADYTVRPMLIQGGTRLPFLAILFGIFGGVLSMGIVGLIIGPVTLVLLLVFVREASIDPASQSESPTYDFFD